MKRAIISGAIFGLALIPFATLGLALYFVELVTAPLTFVPRFIVINLIDTSTASSAVSISLLMFVSAAFYSLVFGLLKYIIQGISKKHDHQ